MFFPYLSIFARPTPSCPRPPGEIRWLHNVNGNISTKVNIVSAWTRDLYVPNGYSKCTALHNILRKWNCYNTASRKRGFLLYPACAYATHTTNQDNSVSCEAGNHLCVRCSLPVIRTFGWSVSEKETEWKLASEPEVTWRGEKLMLRTATAKGWHPHSWARRVCLATLLKTLRTGIFSYLDDQRKNKSAHTQN